jgi:putative N-acetyltransferase (TIGR04045 family)
MLQEQLLGIPISNQLPGAYRIKFATEAWERAGVARLREQVFCIEQGIFSVSDRDEIDEIAIPLVALSYNAVMLDEIAGTVRIHEQEPGLWFGSRLAVDSHHRRAGILGPALIRLAVTTAHARGAHTFLAHVQSANARLFHKLHWKTLHEEMIHGRPHHFMQADLDYYQPWSQGATGFMVNRDAAMLERLHAA